MVERTNETLRPTDPVIITLADRNTAKWIRSYDRVINSFYWECSKCDKGAEHATEFCPHCGAKMEKEF